VLCNDQEVSWPPVIAATALGLVVAGFALESDPANLHNGLIAVSALVMGVSILRFHVGHREGQLFVAVGVTHAVMFFGRQYGRTPSYPAVRWIAWCGVWPLPMVLVLVAATVMCFPDGRFPGDRWKIAFGAIAIAGAVLTVLSALWGTEYERVGLAVTPPFVLPGRSVVTAMFDVARPASYTAIQVVWAACVAARLTRARGSDARQLQWFVFAVGLNLAVLVGGLLMTGSPRAGLLTVPLLPVAAGIGIIANSYEVLLGELRASSKRMMTAQDAARRQLERDLHDGVQHGLVVLGLELGRLVELAEADGNEEITERARTSRRQLLLATAELRELARGIHPAVLTEDGLGAAIGLLADRSPIPVRVRVDMAQRCRPETEATAYFVAGEGLTNAARYSDATHVTVSVERRGAALTVEVVDDGVGGAQVLHGLQGLADRVTATGGRFEVDSPIGRGTRLVAVIPCE
jgi:signal transduction histidine kinase